MVLQLLPDAELLTVLHLQGSDELANVYANIHTRMPPEPTWPIIRVVRVGGSPVVRQWLDTARLQVDVWADDKAEAHDLARTVQANLHDMVGVHDEGVVTAVEDGVFRWNPDDDYGVAGYTFDVLIYLHPNPGVAGS